MKKKIVFFIAVLSCAFIFAQEQFKTHAVKKGETISSIARQYQVSTDDLYRLNPELKNGLKKNTIIVVPAKPTVTNTDGQVGEVTFRMHKVRRKETLFSIAQQYNVLVGDIKRYNKELYSRQLKKGEKIRIPIFPPKAVEAPNPQQQPVGTIAADDTREGLEVYTVQPKEGKWRIAYERGITVDELEELNPNMRDVLQAGDEIWVPKEKVTPVKKADTNQYSYYTVQPKEGFYRLKVKFGVSQEELIALNPELKDGLKKGMVIKLPKDAGVAEGGFKVKDGELIQKFSLVDSINNPNVNFSVVLPFRLERIDTDSSLVEQIKGNKLLSRTLDFYTGVLSAIDSAQQLGISVNAHIFDSKASEATVAQLLQNNTLTSSGAVIGPFFPKSFNRLASDLRSRNVPVFTSLSYKDIEVYDNVFQTIPTDVILRNKMYSYLENNAQGKNIVIIADRENAGVKSKLQQKFPQARIVTPTDDNFIRLQDVSPVLSTTMPNWVIVESNKIPLLTNVTGILASAQTDDRKITMFTTLKGDAYDSDNIKNSDLSLLHFHYPTVDKIAPINTKFDKKYAEIYGTTPNRYAVRGFDLTMDVILRLAYHKDLESEAMNIGETGYVENKFNYLKKSFGGYQNIGVYIVEYDNLDIKEVE